MQSPDGGNPERAALLDVPHPDAWGTCPARIVWIRIVLVVTMTTLLAVVVGCLVARSGVTGSYPKTRPLPLWMFQATMPNANVTPRTNESLSATNASSIKERLPANDTAFTDTPRTNFQRPDNEGDIKGHAKKPDTGNPDEQTAHNDNENQRSEHALRNAESEQAISEQMKKRQNNLGALPDNSARDSIGGSREKEAVNGRTFPLPPYDEERSRGRTDVDESEVQSTEREYWNIRKRFGQPSASDRVRDAEQHNPPLPAQQNERKSGFQKLVERIMQRSRLLSKEHGSKKARAASDIGSREASWQQREQHAKRHVDGNAHRRSAELVVKKRRRPALSEPEISGSAEVQRPSQGMNVQSASAINSVEHDKKNVESVHTVLTAQGQQSLRASTRTRRSSARNRQKALERYKDLSAKHVVMIDEDAIRHRRALRRRQVEQNETANNETSTPDRTTPSNNLPSINESDNLTTPSSQYRNRIHLDINVHSHGNHSGNVLWHVELRPDQKIFVIVVCAIAAFVGLGTMVFACVWCCHDYGGFCPAACLCCATPKDTFSPQRWWSETLSRRVAQLEKQPLLDEQRRRRQRRMDKKRKRRRMERDQKRQLGTTASGKTST